MECVGLIGNTSGQFCRVLEQESRASKYAQPPFCHYEALNTALRSVDADDFRVSPEKSFVWCWAYFSISWTGPD